MFHSKTEDFQPLQNKKLNKGSYGGVNESEHLQDGHQLALKFINSETINYTTCWQTGRLTSQTDQCLVAVSQTQQGLLAYKDTAGTEPDLPLKSLSKTSPVESQQQCGRDAPVQVDV